MGWEGREAASPPGAAAPSWGQPASRSQVLAPPSKHLGIQVKPCQPHTCRGVTAQVLGAGAIFKGWGCRLCPEVDGSRELSPCLGSEGGRVRAQRDPGPQQHGGVLDVCPQSPSPCPPSTAGEPVRVQGPIPPPQRPSPRGGTHRGSRHGAVLTHRPGAALGARCSPPPCTWPCSPPVSGRSLRSLGRHLCTPCPAPGALPAPEGTERAQRPSGTVPTSLLGPPGQGKLPFLSGGHANHTPIACFPVLPVLGGAQRNDVGGSLGAFLSACPAQAEDRNRGVQPARSPQRKATGQRHGEEAGDAHQHPPTHQHGTLPLPRAPKPSPGSTSPAPAPAPQPGQPPHHPPGVAALPRAMSRTSSTAVPRRCPIPQPQS